MGWAWRDTKGSPVVGSLPGDTHGAEAPVATATRQAGAGPTAPRSPRGGRTCPCPSRARARPRNSPPWPAPAARARIVASAAAGRKRAGRPRGGGGEGGAHARARPWGVGVAAAIFVPGKKEGRARWGGWLSSSCQARTGLPPSPGFQGCEKGQGGGEAGQGVLARAWMPGKGRGQGPAMPLTTCSPRLLRGPRGLTLLPSDPPARPLGLLCHVLSPLCAWVFQGCKQTPPHPKQGLSPPPCTGCPSAASCNRSRCQAVTQLPHVWSPASPGAEAGGETAGEDGALGAAGLGVAELILVGKRPLSTAVPHLDAMGLRLEPS